MNIIDNGAIQDIQKIMIYIKKNKDLNKTIFDSDFFKNDLEKTKLKKYTDELKNFFKNSSKKFKEEIAELGEFKSNIVQEQAKTLYRDDYLSSTYENFLNYITNILNIKTENELLLKIKDFTDSGGNIDSTSESSRFGESGLDILKKKIERLD